MKTERSKEVPKFYRISQVFSNNIVKQLFANPIFCTQTKGLQLGLDKCYPEDNLAVIDVRQCDPEEQKSFLENASEDDLVKYIKEEY